MKFKDFLIEKFLKGVTDTVGLIDSGYVEYFVNPTSSELKSISNSNDDGIRLIATDKPKPEIYAWRGDHFHGDAIDNMNNLKKGFGFYYEYSDSRTVHSDDDGNLYVSWEKYKNKAALKKKLKKLFPRATKLDVYGEIYDL